MGKCNEMKLVYFQVRLIDTGKIVDQIIANLYEYVGEQRKVFDLAPRCFECSLAQVQPSQIRYPNGHWPVEAKTLFESYTSQRIVEIEVRFHFSFVHLCNYLSKKNDVQADVL